jgi:hypothetical protein
MMLQRINAMTSHVPGDVLGPNTSRLSRSLQRDTSAKFHGDHSFDGSTTELFYDAESELYMSDDSSEDDEDADTVRDNQLSDNDSDSDTEQNAVSVMSDDLTKGPVGFSRRTRLPVPMPEGMEEWIKHNFTDPITFEMNHKNIHVILNCSKKITENIIFYII